MQRPSCASASCSSDAVFESARSESLSGSASAGSICSPYSYYSKQQELLKWIHETHALLSAICSDHRNDRFPLLYPKFQSAGAGGSSASRSRSANSSNNNSSSPKGRFQLIGIHGTRTSSSSPSAVPNVDLSVLEEASLGKLMAARLDECREYLERLAGRVKDKTSRVLVTGDVNGGKSTLINAFLACSPPILPMDQQPCTQAFCEVIPCLCADSQSVIHALPDYDRYNPHDASTYDLMSVSRMQTTVQEDDTPYQWYRVLLPRRTDRSILCNELVQVSLIDSPGLNSDLFKTMNLFSRQEEIDAIVFVVNAANHLTLSAREFLETAGRDKVYIFIVVNKFDDIRNKDKCRRVILQQIADVLPATAAEAHDLVHFVSARTEVERHDRRPPAPIPLADIGDADAEQRDCSFARLEACLSEFILSKRTKSKLLPAKTYLVNLLGDLQVLLEHNERHCQDELQSVRRDIDILTPCYEELVQRETPLRQDLLQGVTDASHAIYTRSSATFVHFEARIRETVLQEPWSGVLSVWAWRKRVLERVEREAGACVVEAQRSALDTLKVSLDYLCHTALGHAASVYGKEPPSSPGRVTFVAQDVHALAHVPTWHLFDLTASLFSLKTAVRTLLTGLLASSTVVLASTFTNVGPSLLSAVLRTRRLPLIMAVSGGVLSLASLVCILDFEHMARLRLLHSLAAHYSNPTWKHRHCHQIESACHQHLMAVSGGLLQKFQEALAQQRRMRAEKDLRRAQLSSRLEQVVQQNRRITVLFDCVHAIVL